MKDDVIDGYKEVIKMLRAEIQDLKKYQSECIRLENLLHGYKTVTFINNKFRWDF